MYPTSGKCLNQPISDLRAGDKIPEKSKLHVEVLPGIYLFKKQHKINATHFVPNLYFYKIFDYLA